VAVGIFVQKDELTGAGGHENRAEQQVLNLWTI
jgi:hypothetical protein